MPLRRLSLLAFAFLFLQPAARPQNSQKVEPIPNELGPNSGSVFAFPSQRELDGQQSKNAASATGPSGIISTVAGDGFIGDDGNGGPATNAQLINPTGVAVDSSGNFYIADPDTQVVRKVTASTGIITVYAGTGEGGYSGDGGKATAAKLNQPYGLAVDSSNNLYIADARNNVIREVNAQTGIITTVAGNGVGADEPGVEDYCGALTTGVKATNTSLCLPYNLALDSSNNLYIATEDQVVKVTASTGILTIVAGTGVYGYSGDNGPAVNAELSYPEGLALDKAGNLYIADEENCAIRKVAAATQTITSLVGTPSSDGYGTCSFGANPGDGGPAALASVLYPDGVAVDGSGNLFIADSSHGTVRMISAATGDIYTVAGSYANYGGSYWLGNYGYLGDGGPGNLADISYPWGVALDSSGDLYIADEGNSVVREVTSAAVLPTGAPVITPAAEVSAAPVSVSIASAAKGETIYYTTNGTLPSTKSSEYTAPFTLDESAVVTAFATVPGGANTTASEAAYLYAPAPTFNPGDETITKATQVAISDGNSGAKIYYTTDGSSPVSSATAKLYTGTLTVSPGTVLNAAIFTTAAGQGTAVYSAWSAVSTAAYPLPPAAAPVFSPAGGTYSSAQSVTITDATSGATIYYTTNGTAPTTSSTKYTGAIHVAATETITALAVAANFSNSETAAVYTIASPIGTQGTTQSATIAITSSFTLGSISVLTQGSPNLDYALATGGSCKVGTAYTTGQSCTVAYTFKPTAAGFRPGAIELFDKTTPNAVMQASVSLAQTGFGPQVGFQPGVVSVIGSGLPDNNYAYALNIAVDGGGDIFVADDNGNVYKGTPGAKGYTEGTAVSSSATGGLIESIAIDAGGSLYLGVGCGIDKETPSGSTYIQTQFGPDACDVTGLAVDASGNVYAAAGPYGAFKFMPGSGGYTQTALGSGFTYPVAVSVDGAGNVYIADMNQNPFGTLYKETPVGGTYQQSVVATGLFEYSGIALDGVGNLYVVMYNGGAVVTKLTPSGSGYTQTAIGTSQTWPETPTLAVNSAGNVYVAAAGNIYKIDLADAPSVAFATTAKGKTSAAQTISLVNNGNAALTLPIPASGNNPSISANFTLTSGGTGDCPLIAHSSKSAGTLAAGTSCLLPISFAPATTGSLTGSLVLTDTNLNASGAKQTLSLSGTGK